MATEVYKWLQDKASSGFYWLCQAKEAPKIADLRLGWALSVASWGVIVQAKPVSTLHVATYRHHDEGMLDWKRLGEHVIARRIALNMHTRDALAQASGISYRILGDIETGRRDNFDPVTLAKLERALGWLAGSARRVADGDEATLIAPTQLDQGTDTGSLSAIAIPGMPPNRANYQQRPGRANRNVTEDELPDDALIRVMNSELPDADKARIVRQLIAEQRRFAQQRVDELLRDAFERK